jgi:predicted PurR-regulated permease PerM
MLQQAGFSPLARVLIVAAAACVVAAFMRWAAPILAPILLAFFITIIAIPPLQWMRRKGLPKYLAVLIILLVLLDVGSLIALTTTGALEALQTGLPRYQERLVLLTDEFGQWLETMGIDKSREALRDLISPAAASRFVYTALTNASGVVSNGLLVLLIVAFMLAEASAIPQRLRAAFSASEDLDERLQRLLKAINRYMMIKLIMSVATAVCIWIWLWAIGIDYAAALAIAAFLLNFIPVVGNILMTVPAVLVALVQSDLPTALMVVLGYTVVNLAIGNVLEPRLTGRELGISSVLILLSLLFWGWVLGPVGLFLSVPLTMAVMEVMHAYPGTRPIAILLGSSRNPPGATETGEDASTTSP